jgi:serine/threonine-protein kinase RsbW
MENPEERDQADLAAAKVTIAIPCRAEYVAIARLATLGIANRLAYTYDEIEDIRLAVGEACTHAVERALACEQSVVPDPTIWIDSRIGPDGLAIEVRDNVPPRAVRQLMPDSEYLGGNKQDLGALLLEILVDRFSVRTTPEGTSVLLVKNAPIAMSSRVAQ